jgi:carbon-monoxide dehydrogenase large subunit
MDKVRSSPGDTGVTPYGGGTWASRGAGIGGEAVLLAGRALRSNMLDVAAAVLKVDKAEARHREQRDRRPSTREPKLPLAELGAIAYFRPIRCRSTSSPS